MSGYWKGFAMVGWPERGKVAAVMIGDGHEANPKAQTKFSFDV